MSELPEEWANTNLDSLIYRIVGGGTPSKSNISFFQGHIPFMTVKDMKERFPSDTIDHISEEAIEYSATTVIPADTLIIATRMSLGKIVRPRFETAINQDLKALFLAKEIDKTFIEYWWRSRSNLIQDIGTGTTVKGIRLESIRSLSIDVPPAKEQKRIADKLDELFVRVDSCRDQLDHVSLILKRFRQSVLSAATSGKLTEDWRTEHDLTAWQNATLSEICISVTDGDHQAPPQMRYGIPFITIAAINDGFLRLDKATRFVSNSYFENLKTPRKPEVGDILFSVTGSIAIPALVDTNEPFTFQRHIAILKPDLSKILSKFLLYSLDTDNLQKQAIAVAKGTAQKTIPLSGLRAFVIQLPPIDEQQEIVRRVEMLFANADRLESLHRSACDQIEQLIPALLDQAFRGDLVPQDSNDEPASILLEKIKIEKSLMESEQKTERTARRSTKQTPKATMKQPSDYLETLRNAFESLDKPTDARQLFDQAGFSPEDVVPFYEALRLAPEIRAAFERPREQRSLQPQNSTEKIPNQPPSENRRFRLIKLWLEDFKNLADYTVCFDPAHSIDVVLGWNGTGKSNLFEALVIIFRDLSKWYEKNQWSKIFMKGYQLSYVIDGKTVEISWRPRAMKRPKLTIQLPQSNTEEANKPKPITRAELPLPRFIFGYYSGPTNRLAEHFLPMNQEHYNRLRDAEFDDPETLATLLEERRFFCAENHHAKYVLLAFFYKEDPAIGQFLEDRLRIIGFESALFVIRKPRWAKQGQTAKNFWGARGVMRRVIERLRRFAIAPMLVKQNLREGYTSKSEEHYYFFLPDLQSLHAFAAEYQDARTFFLALESIDFSELIYDLKIQVRVKSNNTEEVPITFHELSEGEQQLLMVLGLMRFTKSHQSLVLLDEPDTHLNPHWSIEYLKLLTRLMSEDANQSEEQQTSQILMSTHDPLVIASLFKEQIHLLRRDWETGVCKWTQPSVNPRGLGFTGILTSEMFGMRSDLDEETLADLDNKVRLVAKEGTLTPNELEELEEINKRLEDAGFQKAFSDPYYAAFIRAWSQRHNELMAGVRFLNPAQQQEVDRIAREVLEEVMLELQAEAVG
jgi:restriction endonuclease S subunit/energy-coupling factor transporter ATP-binding protein EcfA2